jgi:hypothetical protein
MGTGALSPRVKQPGREADHAIKCRGQEYVDLYSHSLIRLCELSTHHAEVPVVGSVTARGRCGGV